MAHGRERRERWTNRYQRMDGEQFGWFLPVAPRQLIELLDGPSAPKPGRALDLGCGPGVATCELSGRFDQAAGLDYAYPALERARERLAAEGRTAWLLAADAAGLPFCGGSFNLLFDRGCLQNIPRGRWEAYFREVTRVLTLEGVLQLLCSRTTRRPKLLSARGIKVRLRAVVSEPTRLSPVRSGSRTTCCGSWRSRGWWSTRWRTSRSSREEATSGPSPMRSSDGSRPDHGQTGWLGVSGREATR